MRTRFLLVIGLHLVVGAFPTAARGQGLEPLKILFIGNSYTQVNDLPKMLAALAKEGGQRLLVVEKETPGGWSFKKHWEGGKAVPKIQSKKWDWVVLQNHSLGALEARDDMFTFGKKLHEEVKKQGAKTLLYMTWARQDKPDTQAKITEAYEQLGKELKADVAPVGLAWQAALKADPKLTLHTKDKSHPTRAGTFLAACVFYARIFGKSPEGLSRAVADLTDPQARDLAAIAWKTVSTGPGGK